MESIGDLKKRYNVTVVQDEKEEKMVNSIMHPCRERLTKEMQKDDAFGALFQEFHFSGSYYDKLAVGRHGKMRKPCLCKFFQICVNFLILPAISFVKPKKRPV